MNRHFSKDDLLVITLGGNAVLPVGKAGTIDEQFNLTRATMAVVAELIKAGVGIVLSHGNGPIVGNILIRNETASDRIAPMPLFICGADSQGGIGFMLQNALRNELSLAEVNAEVATVVTQVEVDGGDPAFSNPTKPIGPYYGPEEARRLTEEKGWVMRGDVGRGLRRVVASPEPRRIVEMEAIRRLLAAGVVAIAAGGGGVPVRRSSRDGLLKGVDAVIDKDLVAALMARELGATHLVFVTNTDAVAIHFDTDQQRYLDRVSVEEIGGWQAEGHFPPGSMGPKMEAALRFIRDGGRQVFVCSPSNLSAALKGEAGTVIHP